MPQASCLWCERLLLFNPLFSNSLNSLSSAFENNNSRSRLSLLPPVPQNLSPSLAVLGISPITQIESFPSTRLPPRSRVSFFDGDSNYIDSANDFISTHPRTKLTNCLQMTFCNSLLWFHLRHHFLSASRATRPARLCNAARRLSSTLPQFM